MKMRAFKSTSHYPAYNHTSYNLELREGRVEARLSFHVKHAWAGGGFWFGLRPEFEIHRVTDRMHELLKKMRHAAFQETCVSCGKKEFLKPGEHEWYHLGRIHLVCPDCQSTKTVAELREVRGY